MPAPSAAYILSMLNPYAGFKPDSSGAIALGQQGIQLRGQNEQKRQFDLENARADEYLGLQQHQFEVGNAQKERDKRVQAYADFSDAITAGDTERAARAAEILGAYGVEVEAYDGEQAPAAEAGPEGQGEEFGGTAAGAAQGAISGDMTPRSAAGAAAGAMAQQSPTTMMAESRAKAQAGPPAPRQAQPAQPQAKPPAWLQREMELRGEAPQEDPFAGLEAPEMARPGPARTLSPQPEDMLVPGPQAAVETVTPPEDSAGSLQEIARAAKPKPGRFPTEIGGDKYDPQTGNRIGPAGMNEAEAAAQAPRRGYRIRFEGQEINISPEQVQTRQRERIAAAFDPIISSAPDTDKRAAKAAKDTAMQLVGLVPINQAIKRGFDTYEAERERSAGLQRAKYSAAGRQVSVGFNKEDTMRLGGVQDDVESYIKNIEGTNNLKMAREVVDNGMKIQELLKSNNSIADWAAKQDTLKSFLKGALSDRDVAGFQGAAGKIAAFEQELNNWFNGGEAPADFKRKLGEVVLLAEGHYRKKLAQIATQARADFEDNPSFAGRLSRDDHNRYADIVESRISGRRVRKGAGPGGGTKAAPKGSGAAPSGGGGDAKQKRADDLLKRMRR